MMMEGQGEAVVVCNDQLQLFKGKRSKRPRQMSPPRLAMVSSPMTTTATTSSGGESGRNSDGWRGFASPTTSIELAESTEEDEDMANCLILLARGQTIKSAPRPVSVATTSKTMTTGIDAHRCKTCDRCFPSFQALGGHRASHKKPKVVNNEENNKGLMFVKEDVHQPFNNMNTTLSLQITCNPVLVHNSKTKVHECSMCGAEFSSGQALGGHMRRHRTLNNVPTTTAAATMTTTSTVGTRILRPESEDKSKKPRTVLQLDLNLPAPEDDQQRETKLSVASKQEKLLLFSASSLVHCHY